MTEARGSDRILPTSRRDRDAESLYQGLGNLPTPSEYPALVLLSGLPGSGKSHFCRELVKVVPSLVVLESDALREILFPDPTHGQSENARLFPALHRLLERLLRIGHQVAVDATNLRRRNRRMLYDIAERVGAPLLIIETTAPEGVIRQRLSRREADIAAARRTDDISTAGNDVYDRMIPSAQPIRRDHITVDTSQDITPVVQQVAAELRPSLKSVTSNPL